MDTPSIIASAQILRVSSYVTLEFPDNAPEYRYNISIKDRNGDTEFDGFGHSVLDAVHHCMDSFYELGVDEKPKHKDYRRFRRVAGFKREKIPEKGWAITEMWSVICREAEDRYSLTVTPWENDAPDTLGSNTPVLHLYASTIDELHEHASDLGYELVLGSSFDGKKHIRTWTTLVP